MDETTPLSIPVAQLDPELPLPGYAHPGDAGADLYAASAVEIKPGGRAIVPTGVAVEMPDGYVGLVHPRSGLAAKLGVTVLNAPGTIDSGYRGEIMVILVNHDPRRSRTSRGATGLPSLSCSASSAHTFTASRFSARRCAARVGMARPVGTPDCSARVTPGGTRTSGASGGRRRSGDGGRSAREGRGQGSPGTRDARHSGDLLARSREWTAQRSSRAAPRPERIGPPIAGRGGTVG